jgi:3-oxoacid CoA-transferase A subunit
MIDKTVSSLDEAVADIWDGATVMIGGFLGVGAPWNLIEALTKRKVKNLTVIANAFVDCYPLTDAMMVKKLITSYAVGAFAFKEDDAIDKQWKEGKLIVDQLPEGILSEAVRAGGMGIAAFYSNVGAGTFQEEGRDVKNIDGVDCVLYDSLRADFALIAAATADKYGNLTYRKTARNINPLMAAAADVTISEVTEIVEPGEIDPEHVITPGIFVKRMVIAQPVYKDFFVRAVAHEIIARKPEGRW